MKKKAIVLFSGGLDSTTTLAFALKRGFECTALSFDYGQKHRVELKLAKNLAQEFNIKNHIVLPLSPNNFSGSALTEPHQPIPDYREAASIPSTYVPARNTLFLAYALAWAERLEADDIFIGVSHIDYSGYPDCRPEFIQAFEKMANLATKRAIEGRPLKIHTPLIELNKAETIALGISLGVDYSKTVSCYAANEKGEACGCCDSCHFRRQGFNEAGIEDPTLYQPVEQLN